MAEIDDIRTIQYYGSQYFFARCLHCIADLGVADHLGESAATSAELAASVGAHPDALARIMRYLAAGGVFENTGGRFRHSALSRLLRTDHPSSQRAWIRLIGAGICWQSAGALAHSLRTGRPAVELLHPEGMFAHLSEHPVEARLFDEGMTSKSLADISSVLRAYDFSACRRIADIGGGSGHLIHAVLDSAPGASGVLFDLPPVIKRAAALASDRLSLQAGSFLTDTLPACDTYLMMNVIHDWADAEATTILRAVRHVCAPAGRLLLIESLLPDQPRHLTLRDRQNLSLDVRMIVFTGGRERTCGEYQALLTASGFRLARVIETDSAIAIIEATPT